MRSFIFWQRWFFYSSLSFALFGIVFAIYGDNPFFLPYNKGLAHIFGFGDNIPVDFVPFKAFSILQKALPIIFTWREFK